MSVNLVQYRIPCFDNKTNENMIFKRPNVKTRSGYRTAATSKMERFVIIVNGWKPLTIITKRSILDVAAVLDSPLKTLSKLSHKAMFSLVFLILALVKKYYIRSRQLKEVVFISTCIKLFRPIWP